MNSSSILVVNPNTSQTTAELMMREISAIALPDSKVKVLSLPADNIYSADKVFSYIDLAYAVILTIRTVMQYNEPCDGVLIAGFSDVALDPLREMLNIPVVGIGEVACHYASLLSHRFSILTGTEKWTPPKHDTLARHGLSGRVASYRSYSEWNSNATPDQILDELERVSRLCISIDRAEAIVIGAGPLVGYGRLLQDRISVPVIDPTLCGYVMLENFIRLGLSHSKELKWKCPPTQIFDAKDVYQYNRTWVYS